MMHERQNVLARAPSTRDPKRSPMPQQKFVNHGKLPEIAAPSATLTRCLRPVPSGPPSRAEHLDTHLSREICTAAVIITGDNGGRHQQRRSGFRFRDPEAGSGRGSVSHRLRSGPGRLWHHLSRAGLRARARSGHQGISAGRARFIAEGRTLAALHRVPGIVLVHDFLETNGTAYLVMELLGGQTLQARVARGGPLDAASLDTLLPPLLDGLEQVHAAGFLHRDIKPANILLDDQGRPTLIDFGASRAAVAGRSQAMTAVFTAGYAAVEQFTAARQGPWTDIYGLAATLHFAVTGQPPANAVDRVLDDAYEPLADGRRPFAQNLLAAIDAGLAVRAADRPQSIAAWRTLLSQPAAAVPEAAATVVMRGAPPAAAAGSSAQRTGRGRAAMAFAAVAVAGVAAGSWFLLSPRSTTTQPAAAPTLASAPASPAPDRGQEELEQARRDQKAALGEAARLRAEAEV